MAQASLWERMLPAELARVDAPLARWLRFVPEHLPGAFPYLPGQSGYNKRLHVALPLLKEGAAGAGRGH